MNYNKAEDFFFNEVLKQDIIDGFPYPEKECPICGSVLQLSRVAHVLDTPENFKALYVCLNDKCDAYDVGKKAYVKVYFSSQEAYDKLGALLMQLPRREVK
jgi:hypothetical protein